MTGFNIIKGSHFIIAKLELSLSVTLKINSAEAILKRRRREIASYLAMTTVHRRCHW